MVQGKKASDLSNGSTKYRDQQSNMPFQRGSGGSAAKSESRPQNGNAAFRTDSAISGGKAQGERTLQRWVPDAPEDVDTSLESGRMKSSTGVVWDQFAENEKRFGLTTDYDENIYTTTIDKSHPQYKQRLAEAEKKAREIERSATNNAHVAEERITDNFAGNDNGLDEEDKYSGVRRQDFPPLAPSNNRYTPPARRAPTGQATVSGAPVDPAIISSQLARPDKPVAEKSKPAPAAKAPRAETATPPTTTESSFVATPESKVAASSSHAPSPQPKPQDTPSAAATSTTTSTATATTSTTTANANATTTSTTATVEQAVASAFKGFAARERRNVDQIRSAKIKNDKEVKLNDLKKFADSFKLNTPVPSDLVSIIAKDPAKQKEIQEKAKRNAEEAKNAVPDASKTAAAAPDAKAAQRPVSTAHGPSPSNAGARQGNRGTGFQPPYSSQTYRADRPSQPQQPPASQQNRAGLASRLRHTGDIKASPAPINPIPSSLEPRAPPTGPANPVDPSFSRRSSGVASAQGARLNPTSTEFRPSPHAQSFSPNGNRSTGSSPKSSATLVDQQPSPAASRSLLKRKPVAEAERPSVSAKFDALEHIKSIKPVPEKKWDATGGLKPAYDTQPTWRQLATDEKPDSTMHLTYTKLFELAPFPTQTMSPSNPAHVVPQVPHQHQLPFHLQQGVHNMGSRQSPRQPPMNPQGGHHHGPNPPFNGSDDHRMMSSHSAQSFASPRLQNAPMAFPSPMNQPAQLAYNPQMMPYPGAPPIPQYRSLSQSHQFMPQQAHMGPPIMMQNPAGGFMASPGMAPAPQMMYPQGGQGHFMPPGNGHPPAMPVNGYPSPGRSAPMMMSQGSQQGHQQPMYAMNPGMSPGMNPGMSPGPQFGAVAPIFAQQQAPGQMPMRGYGGPNQLGTSPQQMHQFGPQQHRNNHQNGNFNNNKNFQHGQHPNGPQSNQIPTGPQARTSEGGEEAK